MSSEQPSLPLSRPQRILACVGCQQRKIKCDRNFPCSNCTKSKIACTPATKIPRARRRRRFAENDLLSQLRKYEELLRQNNIDFEPLNHETPNTKPSPEHSDHQDPDQAETPESTLSTTVNPTPNTVVSEVKSFWHAVHQRFDVEQNEPNPLIEEYIEDVLASSRDSIFVNDNSLLFGRQTPIDLSPLHPDPAQIFRLWQIFLDNVNPLFRVIHTPTMQIRIVEAIGDIQAIQPAMEALMFSIYSMAVLSLQDDDCIATFAISKSELLTKYQFGCQQALQNSEFLKSDDRDCLTAFFLYLFSYAHNSDPKALSSTVAIAIRIAQRLQLDRESECAQQDFLEGEMRRRLWWALLLFDQRVTQLSGSKNKACLPGFTTRVPHNINDSTLLAGSKDPPPTTSTTATNEHPTEAIYAVVKATMMNYICHTNFHLAFNAPELISLARTAAPSAPLSIENSQIAYLEKHIEERYLKLCNPQDPLHFLTIWESRALIAKCRLMEYYSINLDSEWTETQLDNACQQAIRFLECDTTIKSSPLTRGFHWMGRFYFPFPAYVHCIKHLQRAPLDPRADHAWEAMSSNFLVWHGDAFQSQDAIFKIMGKLVLSAWAARETALIRRNEMIPTAIPPIVASIREFARDQTASKDSSQSPNTDWLAGSNGAGGSVGGCMPQNANTDGDAALFGYMPIDFASALHPPAPAAAAAVDGFTYGLQNPWSMFDGTSLGGVQVPSDPSMNHLDWTAAMMDWGVGQKPADSWPRGGG